MYLCLPIDYFITGTTVSISSVKTVVHILSSYLFWTSDPTFRLICGRDVPAGVAQEEDHPGSFSFCFVLLRSAQPRIQREPGLFLEIVRDSKVSGESEPLRFLSDF